MDPIDKKARYKGDVAGGGVRHGKGSYEYPQGGHGFFTYSGQWNSNVKQDKHGIFKVKGISEYRGQFVDGEM